MDHLMTKIEAVSPASGHHKTGSTRPRGRLRYAAVRG